MSRVGIFVDVENLTQWINQDGIEQLVEELTSMGAIIVRRAYARWTNTGLASHQSILNRLGFELIHTFHPVSGKNSADIQIVVDVMEYAWRDPELRWIALATGDSDFSPLFRRLREMGRQVIGAGPRSALSESVKSSCSRFLYIEPENRTAIPDEASRASAFDDAADLLEKALKTFDEPASCSALKARMLNIDSAFDEKQLGFKGFNDFVSQVDTVELVHNGRGWVVSFPESKAVTAASQLAQVQRVDGSGRQDLVEQYRSILRKKNWRSVPWPIVEACYSRLRELDAMPRSEMAELMVTGSTSNITTADARKVVGMLFKAGLLRKMEPQPGAEEEEVRWKVAACPKEEATFAIDRAMLSRLLSGLEEVSIPTQEPADEVRSVYPSPSGRRWPEGPDEGERSHGFEASFAGRGAVRSLQKECIAPLLLQKVSAKELDQLILQARRACRAPSRNGE